MIETDTRERNAVTVTVTEDETMLETGAPESHTDAAVVTQTGGMVGVGARETNTATDTATVNSAKTSKKKRLEERRGRDTNSHAHTLPILKDN
jgi:hypothetical protein